MQGGVGFVGAGLYVYACDRRGPIRADDGTVYFGCDDGMLRAIGDRASE